MTAEKVRRKEACEGSQGRKIRRRRNARKGGLKKSLIVGGERWSPTVDLDFEDCSRKGVQSIARD
jgi:hypothetical protein